MRSTQLLPYTCDMNSGVFTEHIRAHTVPMCPMHIHTHANTMRTIFMGAIVDQHERINMTWATASACIWTSNNALRSKQNRVNVCAIKKKNRRQIYYCMSSRKKYCMRKSVAIHSVPVCLHVYQWMCLCTCNCVTVNKAESTIIEIYGWQSLAFRWAGTRWMARTLYWSGHRRMPTKKASPLL